MDTHAHPAYVVKTPYPITQTAISPPTLAFSRTGGHEYAMLMKKQIQYAIAKRDDTKKAMMPPTIIKSKPNNQRPVGTGGGESR